MDTESSTNGGLASPITNNKTESEQQQQQQVNGLNGYSSSDRHKSHHKSEHRDKHRDNKDRDREKSSKSTSKEHKSSSKDKHTSSSGGGGSSSTKDNNKDRHSSSSHKSSSRDKHRDKDVKHKSSSSKDHTKTSSSHDNRTKDASKRESSSSNSKDKHGRHSSGGASSKDKDRHNSSSSNSKDKHRSEKDKHHSSSRDKERDRKDREIQPEVKETFEKRDDSAREDSIDDEDDNKLVIKEDPDSQDENNDNRNFSTASSCDYSLSQFKKDEPKFDDDDDDDNGENNDDDNNEVEVKEEPMEDDSEEDAPLASRVSDMKRKFESDDEEDDIPLTVRKKIKKEKTDKHKKKKKRGAVEDSEEEDAWDSKPIKKEKKIKHEKVAVKTENSTSESPKKGGRKKKEEEQQEVWKWWEEEKKDDGTKWKFLEHKGPVFAPLYEPLPDNVKFFYDGKEIRLSEKAEEVAGFYAKMLDHDYTTKDIFNNNFFKDWRKQMTEKERSKITDLKKCNFKQIQTYFLDLSEKNRNRTKEEKLALKQKNEEIVKEYGFCTIDGHKEKIGNFKIEPPGLFRGRGEHPKMGMLKKRLEAEDIIINCSKDSKQPKPPSGHRWKEVRHDPNVTWLASWTENVQNQVKYIMLNPSSKMKGEKDMQKYEMARKLRKCIDKIRREYKDDWKSKEMRIRQRAVALYFIDKLALRAGNEKDEDQADTVGCCSLRVEHIQLHEHKGGKEYVVVFDFLGKDSIRYYNEVPVEKRVFKNLQLFMENKSSGDDLFDRLNTQIMNKHLNELMEGLTAKVFRTYNASWTLQQQLDELTNADDSVAEKILSYNRANRAVAILCNHQRSVPKGHEKSMEKLKEKIDAKRESIADAERQVKDAARDAKRNGSVKEKTIHDKKKKMLQRLKEQLAKLEIQETDRDENKTIALGTSKLNYLDPRISVAWCKKYDVPIEKIYNKTQRDKFRWAIDMAGPDYYF